MRALPSLNATCAVVAIEDAVDHLRSAARNLLVGAPLEAGVVAKAADDAQAVLVKLQAELEARERAGSL